MLDARLHSVTNLFYSESYDVVQKVVSELQKVFDSAMRSILNEHAPPGGPPQAAPFVAPVASAPPQHAPQPMIVPSTAGLHTAGSYGPTAAVQGQNASAYTHQPPPRHPPTPDHRSSSVSDISLPSTSSTTSTAVDYNQLSSRVPGLPFPLSEETMAAVRSLQLTLQDPGNKPSAEPIRPPAAPRLQTPTTVERIARIKLESPIGQASAPLANGSPISITRRPRAALAGVRKPASVTSLSDETLLRIFSFLAPPQRRLRYGQATFSHLVRASHVCGVWRNIIVTSPRLWTHLRELTSGELDALDILLDRSSPERTVSLELDFIHSRDGGRADFRRISSAVVRHMGRIQSFSLVLNGGRMAAWHSLLPVVNTAAPSLDTLNIFFAFQPGMDATISLSSLIFAGHAPRLVELSLHLHLMPTNAPPEAFAGVLSFTALDDSKHPREADMRRVMDACPNLTSVTLPAPLADAPLNDGQRDSKDTYRRLERHYGGSRRIKEFTVTDWGERRRDSERDTKSGSGGHSGAIRLVVPTLQLFQHIDMPTVHVVCPTADTFRFVTRRMAMVRHYAFIPDCGHTGSFGAEIGGGGPSNSGARFESGHGSGANALMGDAGLASRNPQSDDAQLVLVDRENRARIFSRCSPAFWVLSLKRTEVFRDLVSLCVTNMMDIVDWRELWATPVPRLESLTILVLPAGLVRDDHWTSVFDVGRERGRWKVPALRRLKISAREPLIEIRGLSEAVESRRVHATSLLALLRHGMEIGGRGLLEELVLDGVRFIEQNAGPEVADVRRSVGKLVLRR